MDLAAVLFDVGDTLVWTDDAALAACLGVDVEAVVEAALALRRAVDAALAPALRGEEPPPPAFDPVAALIDAVGVPADRRAAVALALRDLDRRGALWSVVPPGVHAALERLAAAGLRLAAISNSDGSAAAKVEAAGLTRHLEWVLDSHLEGVAKPDPELFRRGVARLGLPAARCVYVGDVYAIDVLAARAAGLQALLFDRSGRYAVEGVPTVRSFAELADALT